jgi:hypothetical protein
MRTRPVILALAGLLIGLSGDASAQAPRRDGVTAILNARRELELSPRQVAQLDSIERALWADRQRLQAQARPAGDSLRARMRRDGMPRDSAARAAMRQQMEAQRAALRPQLEQLRTRDSTARAAAERILNDTQRAKLREMQAERRGFERGMRAGREARGEGAMRRPGGMRGGMRGEAGRPPQAGRVAPRAPQRPPRPPV